MEAEYNDIDAHKFHQNCCQRAFNIIKRKSSVSKQSFKIEDIESLFDAINSIESIDQACYVDSLDYHPQMNADKIISLIISKKDDHIILYVGLNHVFCGSVKQLAM